MKCNPAHSSFECHKIETFFLAHEVCLELCPLFQPVMGAHGFCLKLCPLFQPACYMCLDFYLLVFISSCDLCLDCMAAYGVDMTLASILLKPL